MGRYLGVIKALCGTGATRKWMGLCAIIGLAHGACAQTLTLDWAVTGGATAGDEARAVTVDAAGNVYVAGTFSLTVDFDPGPGTAERTATNGDNFVMKLDADGNLIWAVAYGNNSSGDSVNDIAVDASGNVYLVGVFSLTLDFDPGAGTAELTSAGGADVYVLKLDASGDYVWASAMGGTSGEDGLGVAVDGSGNVYATGYFQGTADFDPGAGTANLTSAGGEDAFVLKLDSTGDLAWVGQISGTSTQIGTGIKVDASGNVYSCGRFNSTADFDPGAGNLDITATASSDAYVQKLDTDGTLVWAVNYGGSSTDNAQAIALDATGSIYTTGSHRGGDFDPSANTFNLPNAGLTDIFVQKMDNDGNFVWAVSMGGTADEIGKRIAVDASNNVYVSGAFQGTVDFDPGVGSENLTAAGLDDQFALKLDATGALAWVRGFGDTAADSGLGVAADDSGNAYFSGSFQGTIDVDPGTGTDDRASAGNRDYSIQKVHLQFAPVANDDTGETDEETVITALNGNVTSLLDNDTDVNPGDTLTVSAFDATSAEGATVTVDPDGTFTYDPTAAAALQALNDGDSVVDTFSYTITDGIDTDTATVSITVNGIDEDTTPPSFSAVSATPAEANPGAQVTITFDASEPLFDNPDVTVNGDPAAFVSAAKAGLTYTYLYTVPLNAPLGPATIEVSGVDLAGNPGSATSAALLSILAQVPLVAWPAVIALLAAGAAKLRRRKH